MSVLRSVLRVKPVNHAAKAVGRWVLPAGAYGRFERKMPLVDAFEVSLPNGQRIRFEPCGDACSKFLRFDGWSGYERSSTELFYALARHAEVTFDVGAYLGYFGLLAAAARPGGRAYLFEAMPHVARLAERMVRLNPHLKCELVNAAVAERAGTITLYVSGNALDTDSSTSATHRANRNAVTVPAVSLDAFVKDRGIDRVDLLKIDTETTEPAVLRGFAETVRRCRPTFLCEVLDTADVGALEAFARENDYAFAQVTPGGLAARERIAPDTTGQEYNYLFFPKNAGTPMAEEVRRRLG